MEINFSQKIKQINGDTLVDSLNGVEKDVTLGDVCFSALTNLLILKGKTEEINGEEKFKNGMLAAEIYKNKKMNLKVEQIANIKRRIGELYLPEVVVAAWNLLDPEK